MLSSPVLYARGPYRVIANDPDAYGRLYVDTAGAWEREEASFETVRLGRPSQPRSQCPGASPRRSVALRLP